ncbi:MAG: hypothetical protein MR757_07285 [Proteobacteria bacterium]|nr:hypothetical protein [Pseudomonadota bacterium]
MTFLKQAVKICLVYIVCLGLSTACFIGLFHVSVLKFTSTFFYNGCLNLFLSSVLCALLMFVAKRLKPELIRISDIVCAFFMFSSITLGWFILIPVTADRSVSVYTLSYMDEIYPKSVTTGEMEKVFYRQYIVDFGAFDKRFREQLDTGSVEYVPEGNSYRLTEKGRKLVSQFRFFADLFGTQKKLVYPNEYAKASPDSNEDKSSPK